MIMWLALGWVAFILLIWRFFYVSGMRREAGDRLAEKHFGKNA